MIKKTVGILLILLILAPLVYSAEKSDKITEEKLGGFKDQATNAWNETVVISPAWQTIVGTFFGLNLHKKSTEISVRETITFFMIFIMFFVIISDIIKITPLFKKEIIEGVSTGSIASIIITIIVSITGAFINLKDLFMNGVTHVISSLDWEWLNFAINNKGWGIFLTIVIIIPLIIIIHEVLGWISPIIKKYSQVSRAEAKGRQLGKLIKYSTSVEE
jgi:hypothetical protein